MDAAPPTATAKKRPVLLELRSSKWFIIAAVTLATFTDIFLYCVIVPVIPFSLQVRAGIAEENGMFIPLPPLRDVLAVADEFSAILDSCPACCVWSGITRSIT